MNISDFHLRVTQLLQNSLVDPVLQEGYISLLPFLSKEKITDMIQKLEKANLLTEKLETKYFSQT